MGGYDMKSGRFLNGKKDREHTQWEIHNKKEQYKKYEYITIKLSRKPTTLVVGMKAGFETNLNYR